jgi:hypothetical protein
MGEKALVLRALNYKKNIFDTLGRYPIHPFPARMAPGIALDALTNTKKRLRVLDPMMGSGTVLAVAHAKGHQAIGVDLDPLAVLLSRVWTRAIDKKDVVKRAYQVLLRARRAFKGLPHARALCSRHARSAWGNGSRAQGAWPRNLCGRGLHSPRNVHPKLQDRVPCCPKAWFETPEKTLTKAPRKSPIPSATSAQGRLWPSKREDAPRGNPCF